MRRKFLCLVRRWQHFEPWCLPRFHLFRIRRVNAKHGVHANILSVDRQPVLIRHALGLLRADVDLDAALGVELEAGVFADAVFLAVIWDEEAILVAVTDFRF